MREKTIMEESSEFQIKPPTEESSELKFQKAWLSPTGGLHYLGGYIHEQWARLAIGSDVSAPMPQEGGENAKQKLFEAGWVRVTLHGPNTVLVEYDDDARLTQIQFSRLIELTTGSGAKSLVRDENGKLRVLWRKM